MEDRNTWFVTIKDTQTGLTGYGECAPLRGLSIDHSSEYSSLLEKFCKSVEVYVNEKGFDDVLSLIPTVFPSVRMGLETALQDFNNGGSRMIFSNDFFTGKLPVPINGLVWMGSYDSMKKQVDEKLEEGYNCIKMKIGAIDFESETALLKYIRKKAGPEDITLRVDANGAFTAGNVYHKLDMLYKFGIHSIEQPVKPSERELLSDVCKNSPVPVALDESLIGQAENKAGLLDEIRPYAIIIKPTLLGGFQESNEWIEIAREKNIGWWVTSALESNVGLNAISQFTAGYKVAMHQGLGTGKLYHNNVPSPLCVRDGFIRYSPEKEWDLTTINTLAG
jgi:o-succinylbenzoate synthase